MIDKLNNYKIYNMILLISKIKYIYNNQIF